MSKTKPRRFIKIHFIQAFLSNINARPFHPFSQNVSHTKIPSRFSSSPQWLAHLIRIPRFTISFFFILSYLIITRIKSMKKETPEADFYTVKPASSTRFQLFFLFWWNFTEQTAFFFGKKGNDFMGGTRLSEKPSLTFGLSGSTWTSLELRTHGVRDIGEENKERHHTAYQNTFLPST